MLRCLRVCMSHGVLALVQTNIAEGAVYGRHMRGPRVVSHFMYWQPLVFDDTVQPPSLLAAHASFFGWTRLKWMLERRKS